MIVGSTAPNFTTQAFINGDVKSISLSDYKEKWVILFFYSGDFSFVWPTELASLAVRYNEFMELNTEVLAINVDSVYSHKIWNEIELSKMANMNIPYPILSDETGNIGRLYDIYDQQKGTALRGTFIIDPKGYIHGVEILTNPIGRCIGETLRQLKAFQNYVSTGEMAPCDWQPGEKTIVESIEICGDIWKQWKPLNNNNTN